MTPRKPPILMAGALTGRVYVSTSYRCSADGKQVTSLTKHDVHDQFLRLASTHPVTDEMVDAFGKAWAETPEGEPGDRRRAGLRAALAALR